MSNVLRLQNGGITLDMWKDAKTQSSVNLTLHYDEAWMLTERVLLNNSTILKSQNWPSD